MDDDDIDVDVAFYLDKEVVDQYRTATLQPEEICHLFTKEAD